MHIKSHLNEMLHIDVYPQHTQVGFNAPKTAIEISFNSFDQPNMQSLIN